MGDKKLNLNQPFLSVRRHISTKFTKVSKEERKTHNPHRPVTHHHHHHHLPPHKSDLKSGPVSNPGAVPFLWEHTPGQPKNQDTIKSPTHKNTKITVMPPVTTPNLHPGNPALEVVPRGPSHDENIKKETKEESSDSEDNEVYVDCSTSGLNGPSDYIFAKTPSTDREFMMDRFLPAAKAMASPHYVNKKQQHVVEERSGQIKKNVRNQSMPQLRYGPSFAKRYSDYQENEDESDDDDDDEYNQSRNLPGVCGLLPRFCFSHLSPVPAMSVRTRLNNVQPRFSLPDLSTETEDEVTMVESTELKLVHKLQTDELDDDDKKKSRRNEFDGNKGLGSDAKEFKTFEEFLGGQGEIIRTEPNSASPIFEKTLYVDTIHKSNSAHKFDAFSVDKSTKKRWTAEKKATEGSLVNYARHPVPPPLPKSPSDSWLGRTLPSMSNKNSYLRLYPSPRNELSKETMVKTTKVQRRHMHYSEESLKSIPET
ncbi:hypothetical protein CASFOL_025265 [Castilleja foliolosa]|uniref:Uncharacterized protein n=1 Tax=Castilleja foliolosa TaxID=1961234 RepID=A0ABD3CSH5_9LAMI